MNQRSPDLMRAGRPLGAAHEWPRDTPEPMSLFNSATEHLMLTAGKAFGSFSVDDLKNAKAFHGETLRLMVTEAHNLSGGRWQLISRDDLKNVSTGFLPGAHETDCPVHARMLALEPPWARARSAAKREND